MYIVIGNSPYAIYDLDSMDKEEVILKTNAEDEVRREFRNYQALGYTNLRRYKVVEE